MVGSPFTATLYLASDQSDRETAGWPDRRAGVRESHEPGFCHLF